MISQKKISKLENSFLKKFYQKKQNNNIKDFISKF